MSSVLSPRYLALLTATLLVASPPACAGDAVPTATPYRPSLANPAELPQPGWLELEAGWQRQNGGEDLRRDSLPLTAKLAFNPHWGLLLGTELDVQRTETDHTGHRGNGDTTLIVKHLIGGDAATRGAWGVEAGVKLATAPQTLGSGKTDYLLNLVYSVDGLGNRLDLNLGATQLGAEEDGLGRTQTSWAASLSRPLGARWGAFAELSGSDRTGTAATRQYMLGGSYSLNPRLVLDLGLSRGLTAATPDWGAAFGVTWLASRLW